MSELYSISDTTLTALGDAVRNKTIGITELPILEVVNQGMTYNVSNRSFELPSLVKKTKIIGSVDYTLMGVSVSTNGLQGLGVAPNVIASSSIARDDENFIIINEGVGYDEATGQPTVNYNFDFEIVIEGNSGTFACTQNNSSPDGFYLSYIAIGLDENGNEFKYTPLEIADKINNLITIPEEAFNISGSCYYKFSFDGWNWFINGCGNKVKTNNITDCGYMFSQSTNLKNIPFDIYVSNTCMKFDSMFFSSGIKEVPNIIGVERTNIPTSGYSNTISLTSFLGSCKNIRYIPNNFFWSMIPNKDYWDKHKELTQNGQNAIFQECYSLRSLPDISMLGGAWTTPYSNLYYSLCNKCCSLDKIENLNVYGTFNSNYFTTTFDACTRLSDMTFEVNEDGATKTANWKNQTIDLSKSIGYTGNSYYGNILNHNSGITADKEVKDDATYQALKNDPDWFTRDVNYSRYNHDSALNTINSLPDCSAYGTNIIKFMGAAGALTDGGAINTLTAEEIAVATAKGWTVSLV